MGHFLHRKSRWLKTKIKDGVCLLNADQVFFLRAAQGIDQQLDEITSESISNSVFPLC